MSKGTEFKFVRLKEAVLVPGTNISGDTNLDPKYKHGLRLYEGEHGVIGHINNLTFLIPWSNVNVAHLKGETNDESGEAA